MIKILKEKYAKSAHIAEMHQGLKLNATHAMSRYAQIIKVLFALTAIPKKIYEKFIRDSVLYFFF